MQNQNQFIQQAQNQTKTVFYSLGSIIYFLGAYIPGILMSIMFIGTFSIPFLTVLISQPDAQKFVKDNLSLFQIDWSNFSFPSRIPVEYFAITFLVLFASSVFLSITSHYNNYIALINDSLIEVKRGKLKKEVLYRQNFQGFLVKNIGGMGGKQLFLIKKNGHSTELPWLWGNQQLLDLKYALQTQMGLGELTVNQVDRLKDNKNSTNTLNTSMKETVGVSQSNLSVTKLFDPNFYQNLKGKSPEEIQSTIKATVQNAKEYYKEFGKIAGIMMLIIIFLPIAVVLIGIFFYLRIGS